MRGIVFVLLQLGGLKKTKRSIWDSERSSEAMTNLFSPSRLLLVKTSHTFPLSICLNNETPKEELSPKKKKTKPPKKKLKKKSGKSHSHPHTRPTHTHRPIKPRHVKPTSCKGLSPPPSRTQLSQSSLYLSLSLSLSLSVSFCFCQTNTKPSLSLSLSELRT